MPNILLQPEQIQHLLARLGELCAAPATLYLFGGSALLLLGGTRHTGDVDFTVGSHNASDIRLAMAQAASELGLEVEESAPAEFMPLPAGAEERHQLIGRFGKLEVFVFDPYSIAVSKIDRAFESDMEDVAVMLRHGHIEMDFLERCVNDVARRYDEPVKLRANWQAFKKTL
jgi:hypothetical protein